MFTIRGEVAASNQVLPRFAPLMVPPTSVWLLLLMAALGLASVFGSYHGSVSVLLGGAVMVLAIFAVVKSPHMAIVACLLLYQMPTAATDANGPLYRINEPACVLVMLFSVAGQFMFREKICNYSWQPAVLFSILIFGLVTHDLRSTNYNDPLYVCAAISVTGFCSIRTREQLNEVIFAFWLLGVTMAVVSLHYAFRDQGAAVLDMDSTARYGIEGRDQNYYSFVGGTAVACALGAYAEKGLATPRLRLLHWVMLGSSVVVIMGLGIQGSRSAAVGMLVSAVVFVLAVGRRFSAMFVFTLLAAGLASVVAFTPFGRSWIARFSEDTLASGGGRTYMWQSAIEVFSQSSYNMVFGYGSQGSGCMLGLEEGGTTRSTHNMYLALLLDSGLVGIILMAVFLGSLVWRMLSRRCAAPRLGLVLLAYCLTQALFLETQLVPAFWCMMCVVASAAQPRLDSTCQG